MVESLSLYLKGCSEINRGVGGVPPLILCIQSMKYRLKAWSKYIHRANESSYADSLKKEPIKICLDIRSISPYRKTLVYTFLLKSSCCDNVDQRSSTHFKFSGNSALCNFIFQLIFDELFFPIELAFSKTSFWSAQQFSLCTCSC